MKRRTRRRCLISDFIITSHLLEVCRRKVTLHFVINLVVQVFHSNYVFFETLEMVYSRILDAFVLLKALNQVVNLNLSILAQGSLSSSRLCLDEAFLQVLLEPLQTHDLLFEAIFDDESVNVDSPSLANSVGSVYCLHVFHRVPVMLHEDHGVSSW